MTGRASGVDDAVLNYLAGEETVMVAAELVWDAAGQILKAQRFLEAATESYGDAIRDAGIPAEHIERLGAALVLRLNHSRMPAERVNRENPDADHR